MNSRKGQKRTGGGCQSSVLSEKKKYLSVAKMTVGSLVNSVMHLLPLQFAFYSRAAGTAMPAVTNYMELQNS